MRIILSCSEVTIVDFTWREILPRSLKDLGCTTHAFSLKFTCLIFKMRVSKVLLELTKDPNSSLHFPATRTGRIM